MAIYKLKAEKTSKVMEHFSANISACFQRIIQIHFEYVRIKLELNLT